MLRGRSLRLKDRTVQHPSPFPLDQIRRVSPPILLHFCASLTPAPSCYSASYILSRLSDCCQLSNEKGEDATRPHKMNDPQLESEEGKDEGGKNPPRPLIAPPPCKKVKLTFRCSTNVLCLRALLTHMHTHTHTYTLKLLECDRRTDTSDQRALITRS